MKKIIGNIGILFMVYVVGTPAWLVCWVLKRLGVERVVGLGSFPKLEPGLLIVANHSDVFDCMFEIILISAFLYPQVARHPFKLAPWFVLDRSNFTDKWYFAWLRSSAVSIQRGTGKSVVAEARKITAILSNHDRELLYFAEGGRTCTAPEGVLQLSKGGKKIRPFRPTLGWMVQITKAPVFLIWTEEAIAAPQYLGKKPLFSWPNFKRGPITIKFAKPILYQEEFDTMAPLEISKMLASKLLELADEE